MILINSIDFFIIVVLVFDVVSLLVVEVDVEFLR